MYYKRRRSNVTFVYSTLSIVFNTPRVLTTETGRLLHVFRRESRSRPTEDAFAAAASDLSAIIIVQGANFTLRALEPVLSNSHFVAAISVRERY
ncbi:hypothetical protein Trydic_g9528 [Trypoxylus dichotomus]